MNPRRRPISTPELESVVEQRAAEQLGPSAIGEGLQPEVARDLIEEVLGPNVGPDGVPVAVAARVIIQPSAPPDPQLVLGAYFGERVRAPRAPSRRESARPGRVGSR